VSVSARTYARIARLTVELDVLLGDLDWYGLFPGLRELLRKLRSHAVKMQRQA
jgi:hypothetical protein